LLVVIAVIALLIGILLPTLAGSRNESRALKCGTNLRTVAQGVTVYSGDYQYIPPSYVYGADQTGGSWNIEDQQLNNPHPANGYVHWSWALFNGDGGVPEEAFSCPSAWHHGAPRTDPGPNVDDWEANQINDLGASAPAMMPEDRQAKRMAYTGNGAVFPRNKFSLGTPRRNQLVRDARIQFPSMTILATEFLDSTDWSSLSVEGKIKSHRPIMPFVGGSAGDDVYNEPNFGGAPRFFYPPLSAILPFDQLGPDMIEDGNTILNAVGRTHPGPDKRIGGAANFSFIDGHVERMTVLESVKRRLWGDQVYSLTGNTKVGTP
jgi:prepilin-type processing-associated H-X9-DG protein